MTTVQLNTVTRRIEVFSSARDVQARAEIAAHAVAADPHQQYLRQANAAAIATSGDAADLVTGTVPDARMPVWAGYTAASKTALEAASVPATIQAVELLGYAADGDGGGALYRRAASEPTHPGKIQSADSAWWELADRLPRVYALGAAGDGTTDDAGAFAAAESLGRLTIIPKSANGYSIASPVTTTSGAWLPDPTLTWEQLGSGNLEMERGGFYTNQLNGVNIWRFADRVFIGEAATHNAGVFSGGGGGDSWITGSEAGPEYLARSAQLLVSGGHVGAGLGGLTAICALNRSSNTDSGTALGVGAAVVNDKASGNVWGFIAEMQREPGSLFTAGMEIGSKNKGDDRTDTPYLSSNGAFGIWLAAGGDDTFGGASANPSNTAVVILKHSDPAHGWNKGIVFKSDALTGTDGVTGTGVAIEMSRGHIVRWRCAAGIAASIRSDVDAIASSSSLTFINNAVHLIGGNSKRYLQASYPADVVNFTHMVGSATGSPVQFGAAGEDADIDLQLATKGAGVVRFGTYTALGAESLDGYITIKDANGTLRKLATLA